MNKIVLAVFLLLLVGSPFVCSYAGLVSNLLTAHSEISIATFNLMWVAPLPSDVLVGESWSAVINVTNNHGVDLAGYVFVFNVTGPAADTGIVDLEILLDECEASCFHKIGGSIVDDVLQFRVGNLTIPAGTSFWIIRGRYNFEGSYDWSVAIAHEGAEKEEKPSAIKVAAFNIQTFGETKREKEEVMEILVDIAREFDILFIQEIRDAERETVPYYVQQINEQSGPEYAYIESQRLGRGSYKESYAYIYNTETVELIEGSAQVYNDTSDVFEREPYIASFRSGSFDFTVVGIHVKPDDAYSEIGNLTLVVHYLQTGNPDEKDIIVLGDFNADGRYFDEDDVSNPFKALEFYWIITNMMDTMVKTDYTYDRIVLLNETYSYEYVAYSAEVFYFDAAYGISNQTLVEEVSDHYPVFAWYRTDLVDDD